MKIIKKVLSGFIEFLLLGMIITGVLMASGVLKSTSPTENSPSKIAMLAISAVMAFLWVNFFYLKRKKQKRSMKITNDEEFENILKENGIITISKKVNLEFGQSMYVDNINKRWGIIQVSRNNNNKVASHNVFSYNDLIKYEVEKDRQFKTKGRAGSTIAGGLTFGVLGAMAGSSRSKKTTETVRSTSIYILLNNLEVPNISIVCGNLAKANEVSGILEFILANK